MRIQKAQKHVDPVDPDTQHWLQDVMAAQYTLQMYLLPAYVADLIPPK